jgi:thiosulfate/3-mercaptopyruvate sulfurtransferase
MMLPNLISAAELVELHSESGMLVVDCRVALADPDQGARDHALAHVPGAVYAHLDRDLSDLSRRGLGRHPLPDDAAFSTTLSRWGWNPDLAVVAYDDANGALAAARLWWLLRVAGHPLVTVLDGGLAAWRSANLPLESGEVKRDPSSVRVAFDPAAIVGFDELEQLRASGDLLLLDARAAPRYRGEVEPLDAVAGHVPGASNRPYSENLDPSGRFKSRDELHREFENLLAGRDPREVVHMCGSGVTACHNLLAMEHAGLTGSRVFAPSWSGWVSDPSRPIATGTEST